MKCIPPTNGPCYSVSLQITTNNIFLRMHVAWSISSSLCFLANIIMHRFARFMRFAAVMKCIASNYLQELVSHDTKSNTYDYKHTFCVEIVPICRSVPFSDLNWFIQRQRENYNCIDISAAKQIFHLRVFFLSQRQCGVPS